MSRSLKHHLQHVNDGLDTSPLLSEADIRNAMHHTPATAAPDVHPSWWSRNRTAVSFGTAALAVATVIAFVILPDDSFLSPTVPGEPLSQQMDATTEQSRVGESITAPELSESESQVAQGASAQDVAQVDEIQRASAITNSRNGLSTTFLQLSTEEFARLGLTVTSKSIRYDEGSFRITIGTSGIASKGTLPSAREHVTPRHVSLYRNGQVWASWFDEVDPATTPNDLIPVHVHLESPSSTTFPNADAILWYEPTEAFLNSLSAEHRRELGKDLQSKNGDATYVERSTHSSRISASKVYPNPVHGSSATLQLTLASQATTSAEVIDVNGRVVMQLWTQTWIAPGTSDHEVGPLFDLANGMYLIVVTDTQNGERLVQRLLIER